MNHINDLLSPLHDIVTHKTAGTNTVSYTHLTLPTT